MTEFVDGETLTVAALHARPTLLAEAIATIRRTHQSVGRLTPSKASDVLFGYSLDLLAGWRSVEEVADAKGLHVLTTYYLLLPAYYVLLTTYYLRGGGRQGAPDCAA